MNIKSIRVKLPAFFLLVALLPTLLSIIWGSNIVNQRVSMIFQEQAQKQAEITENIFSNYLTDLQLKTQLIAQTPDIQNALIKQDKVALLNRLSQIYQDLNLHLYDTTIELFTPSADLYLSEPYHQEQLTPQFFVIQALGGQYKQVELLENGSLKLVSITPVYNASHSKPIGIIALSFNVSKQLISQIQAIHQANLIIYQDAADKKKVLVSTLPLKMSQQLISDDRKTNQNKLSKFVVARQSRRASNGRYFLAVAIDNSKLVGVMESLQWMLYLIQIGAALFALILAIFLSRSFLLKIKQLVIAAQQIEARNFDMTIDTGATDEFGILSKTLNSMRQEIKDTLEKQDHIIAELTLRDKINQAIISKSGSELLKEVLILTVTALDCQKGSIMLIDKLGERLVLKVVYNHEVIDAEKVMDEVSFKIGEGIAGHVAKTGEPIISNNPQDDKRFKQYHFQEMDRSIKHLVCIPLKLKNEIKGVISLDNKEGGFHAKDTAIVEKILNQLAIALENAELYELSITDGMTGLFIRRYFENNLEKELTRSRRFKFKTSLLIFDIDHFKRFNDTYGHQIGDQVIQKVASLAKKSIRDDIDFPARIGGEEFAIIMPDTDINNAHLIAERLRKNIEECGIEYGDKTLKVTVSIGCSEYPSQAKNKEELIYKADMALYASKQNGRNKTTCYSPEIEKNQPKPKTEAT